MYVTLEDRLSLEIVKGLNLSKDDRVICRDVALDDTVSANIALQCRLKVI
jgi:adenine-specific DNA-methyltransferase